MPMQTQAQPLCEQKYSPIAANKHFADHKGPSFKAKFTFSDKN